MLFTTKPVSALLICIITTIIIINIIVTLWPASPENGSTSDRAAAAAEENRQAVDGRPTTLHHPADAVGGARAKIKIRQRPRVIVARSWIITRPYYMHTRVQVRARLSGAPHNIHRFTVTRRVGPPRRAVLLSIFVWAAQDSTQKYAFLFSAVREIAYSIVSDCGADQTDRVKSNFCAKPGKIVIRVTN